MANLFKAILFSFLAFNSSLQAQVPANAQKIMDKPIYQHAKWALYSKDLVSNTKLWELNPNLLFIPASASKLITVSALLNEFGYDYRFKTPIYALSQVDSEGTLNGNIVLVGSGDLVFGGRAISPDKIAYTNFDHVDANHLPGTILTKQDPLAGINSLAEQIKKQGVKKINGNVLIDDRLFETITKRENILSPILINENLYDIEVTPAELNQTANLTLRPQLSNTQIINKVMTVEKDKPSAISIIKKGEAQFEITGTIAINTDKIVNTYPIENPKEFARAALIDKLKQQGIIINISSSASAELPPNYTGLTPIAVLNSAPLSEYAKLILKVSHNVGANLIPLLLASHQGKTSYNEGLQLIGQFLIDKVHLNKTEISFGDAAGGNDNYITPIAMMKVLEYLHQLSSDQFQTMINTLPILGVDGSLTHVANNTPAQGKVFAKTGTGISYNNLFGNFLLTSKALAGFYKNKAGHWVAFFIVVNLGNLETVERVFEVNNDLGLIANAVYLGGKNQ
jgi:D-alanyl-D-alanine carboxypeptidase/D-alanyl-D-alanine-endopeptidase (penicillin-binding protein 4)